jgi:hypothetical protein
VNRRAREAIGALLVGLCAGCAASGQSNRPPNVAPAPSSASIGNVGFERAVKVGSDYVYASTGVSDPRLVSSQELPAGMLELTFDLGPGVPEPMRLTVDPEQGRVKSAEPVQQIPGITEPAKSR